MPLIANMDWIEVIGWLASILTVATYAMNTMVLLRVFAIGSSVCFLVYGFILELWPLLVMELLLLPINCYRFWQIFDLRSRVSTANNASQDNFEIVQTYGKARRIDRGTVVFKRGDPADRLYYVAAGKVTIEEFNTEVSAGEIFGEIAFFTEAAERTATARCTEDARVYELDRARFMRLQFEDPSFGLSIMRTITRRLIANGERTQETNVLSY